MNPHDILDLPFNKPLTLKYEDREYEATITSTRIDCSWRSTRYHLCVDAMGAKFCFDSERFKIEYDPSKSTLFVRVLDSILRKHGISRHSCPSDNDED